MFVFVCLCVFVCVRCVCVLLLVNCGVVLYGIFCGVRVCGCVCVCFGCSKNVCFACGLLCDVVWFVCCVFLCGCVWCVNEFVRFVCELLGDVSRCAVCVFVCVCVWMRFHVCMCFVIYCVMLYGLLVVCSPPLCCACV